MDDLNNKDGGNVLTENDERILETANNVQTNGSPHKSSNGRRSLIIKIGAAAVAVIVIFNVFSFIFGDKKVKKAQDFMTSEILVMLDEEGITDKSVSSKAIGKNKDASLYAFDTTIKVKVNGEKMESKSFIIVRYEKDYSYIAAEYAYDDENKRDKKEVALAFLARG